MIITLGLYFVFSISARGMSFVCFVIGNIVYTIVTFVLAIVNLIYRRDIISRQSVAGRPIRSEWKEREKKEYCFDICNPLNGLRVFHHLEHRGAALINLIVVVCSAIELSSSTQNMYSSADDTALLSTLLGFSSCILVLTLIQTFLSYFYAEDVALCGV